MENPDGLFYTKEHEWVRMEGGIATVGITDFAQHQLTDIVFVELPEVGRNVEQFKAIAVVESVKSVSDVFSPVSGQVTEVNRAIVEKPETVNSDPFGKGWFFKVRASNPAEAKALMGKGQYDSYLKDAGEH